MMGILLAPLPAHAGLIRDAEVEATLRDYADPIFRAAGLKPSAVNIYIVQDDTLNAFVAGGSNLFIHTGMIMATQTPDMLLGVMAHETGHISGGHLAKGGEKLKNAQIGTIMTYVLGAAAAAATGKPEAAAAVITGGSSSIARNFMSFSRANENAADQAGINFLNKLGISAQGMVEVFELLKRQEMQHYGKSDPYLRTHPLTSERIEFIKNIVAHSSIPLGAYPKNYTEKHARMVAKLFAFLETPEKTLRTYPVTDTSTAGRMARAIAYFKMPDMTKSLAEMDALTNANPNDAYLYDLKGQILFESARIPEAKVAYDKAISLAGKEPLILADLAKTELALNTPKNSASAVTHLEKSTLLDKNNAMSWRLLATAYGKQNNEPMASLALAEEALVIGDAGQALKNADNASATLPKNSPSLLRAQDVRSRAIKLKKEKEDN